MDREHLENSWLVNAVWEEYAIAEGFSSAYAMQQWDQRHGDPERRARHLSLEGLTDEEREARVLEMMSFQMERELARAAGFSSVFAMRQWDQLHGDPERTARQISLDGMTDEERSVLLARGLRWQALEGWAATRGFASWTAAKDHFERNDPPSPVEQMNIYSTHNNVDGLEVLANDPQYANITVTYTVDGVEVTGSATQYIQDVAIPQAQRNRDRDQGVRDVQVAVTSGDVDALESLADDPRLQDVNLTYTVDGVEVTASAAQYIRDVAIPHAQQMREQGGTQQTGQGSPPPAFAFIMSPEGAQWFKDNPGENVIPNEVIAAWWAEQQANGTGTAAAPDAAGAAAPEYVNPAGPGGDINIPPGQWPIVDSDGNVSYVPTGHPFAFLVSPEGAQWSEDNPGETVIPSEVVDAWWAKQQANGTGTGTAAAPDAAGAAAPGVFTDSEGNALTTAEVRDRYGLLKPGQSMVEYAGRARVDDSARVCVAGRDNSRGRRTFAGRARRRLGQRRCTYFRICGSRVTRSGTMGPRERHRPLVQRI